MVKTTVYLPEDLKFALARVARARGESEAEVIRLAIKSLVDAEPRPRPRGGIVSGPGNIARNVDELLNGDADHLGFGGS
ncbi:MAG TPA: CopG family transcriptional regulator [Solirubrobacteraceae bacterium]|nr:CopG family transcriptional regulator [Solirubrobacteraceae bacterium]